MDERVNVTSMTTGQIGIILPEMRIKKIWPRKGTRLPISKDLLREAIYEPGVEYMFKTGMLAIDDMAFKIELGLEPEGADKPTEVLTIDNKYMDRLLSTMSLEELRLNLGKMSNVQKQEFVEYAAKRTDINLDRIKIIDELCHVNMLKIIELNRDREA